MPLPVIPDPLLQVPLSTGVTVGMTDTGGDGPLVVFSHGFLMNHTMFAPQVEALRDAYRVVTYDERAHGEVEPEGRWSYWDLADDVLAILDHLGVERAVLAGMSQGGFLSMRAALRAPERVRALVLMDTQAGVEDPEVLPLFEAMTADWEANGPAQGTLDYAATAILGPGADEEAWKSLWAMRPNHWATPAAHPLLTRDDITERLGEIGCPTLVIHGEADASIPVEAAQVLVDRIPKAHPLMLIPGAGHAANLTHPQIANPAIRSFLDSLGD
ncbi:MAG TPA: alpha/beta hydrolase [Amycolatopsis sp.]|jgi:pimeloyl-ACP methyl ester carboxylesterase|nr:alpha/beta hydrolase [Amycolatopsis sp.]